MITVKDILEISPSFIVRINGDDYDYENDHSMDNWIVSHQEVDVYFRGYMSSVGGEPDEIRRPEYYLYINAEEPESND